MNKKKIYIIILLIILGAIGSTFSYFKHNQKINNTLESNEFSLIYNYLFEKDTSWNPGDITTPEITVENDGEIPIVVRAKFTEEWKSLEGKILNNKLSNGENAVVKTISTSWFKIGDYYYYENIINKNEKTKSLFNEIIYNSNTASNMICTNESDSTTCTANNDYANANYKLNIEFESIQADIYENYWNVNIFAPRNLYNHLEQQTVYDDMKSDNVSSKIIYSSPSGSTNGNGIYTINSTVSTNPIHFFRGEKNYLNNNVIFANKCWLIYMTTDTKGIKMIYNGEPINGTCSTTNKYIGQSSFNKNRTMEDSGYMINNDTENSDVKNLIDTWYENNLINYTNYLEDTIYCNDKTIYLEDETATGYFTITRLNGVYNVGDPTNRDKQELINKCPNQTDSYTVNNPLGNKKLTYPIALINAVEMVYAGGNVYFDDSDLGSTTNYYLSEPEAYWSLTPAGYLKTYNYENIMINYLGKYVGSSKSYWEAYYVRPVITLKQNITYTKGNGTIDNPFVIGEL